MCSKKIESMHRRCGDDRLRGKQYNKAAQESGFVRTYCKFVCIKTLSSPAPLLFA